MRIRIRIQYFLWNSLRLPKGDIPALDLPQKKKTVQENFPHGKKSYVRKSLHRVLC